MSYMISDMPRGTSGPRRGVMSDEVYEALKGFLVDERLGAAAKLNIDQLAIRLEVSATPIREALARLEADGFVTKEPMRGYSVTALLDTASFSQLYEVR